MIPTKDESPSLWFPTDGLNYLSASNSTSIIMAFPSLSYHDVLPSSSLIPHSNPCKKQWNGSLVFRTSVATSNNLDNKRVFLA